MPGRALPPTSPFAGDDGAADPVLAAALAALTAGVGSLADVVTALARARVLVPVVAMAEAPPPDAAPAADPAFAEVRHAAAGVVAVSAPDGRTALPVFSSVATLAAWRSDARPMPAEGPRAAAAALQEGWDLLVVDPGEGAVVVPRPAVLALATGDTWRPAVVDGVVVAAVREAVVRAVAGAPHVLAADAVPGRHADVAVVLTLRPGLSRRELDAAVADVSRRMSGLADAVDSLELRVSGGVGGPPAR